MHLDFISSQLRFNLTLGPRASGHAFFVFSGRLGAQRNCRLHNTSVKQRLTQPGPGIYGDRPLLETFIQCIIQSRDMEVSEYP